MKEVINLDFNKKPKDKENKENKENEAKEHFEYLTSCLKEAQNQIYIKTNRKEINFDNKDENTSKEAFLLSEYNINYKRYIDLRNSDSLYVPNPKIDVKKYIENLKLYLNEVTPIDILSLETAIGDNKEKEIIKDIMNIYYSVKQKTKNNFNRIFSK